MKKNLLFLIFIPVILYSTLISSSQWSDWKTFKTEYFTIFYKPGYEDFAREVLNEMEYYRPFVEKITGNKIYNLSVVIEDAGAITNGSANPFNYAIYLYTYPPSSNSLNFTENWLTEVSIHEYTHMLHMTKAGGTPRLLTNLFGNILLPNLLSPGWITEGITVYNESHTSRYQGRLNDGLFDAYIGASIKDNRFPSILKATYLPLEYPGGIGSYLFGSEFFSYISNTYGEDKFAKFFEITGSRSSYYISPLFPSIGLDSACKKIFGKSFPFLWQEWYKYEAERFKNFAIEGEQITNYGWFIDDLKIYNNKLYYNRRYPVKTGAFDAFWFNEIVSKDISDGKEETIISTTSSFTAPMRIHNNKIYYAVSEIKPGYPNTSLFSYGYYSQVHEKDIITGRDIILFNDEIRSFDILNDRNILFSKNINKAFGSEICLYEIASGKKTTLFNSNYLVDEILINNNKIIVTARKDWENFSIYTLDLGTKKFIPLINTPYLESHISVSENKLFFTANYQKIYALYSYNFSTGKIYQITKAGFADFPVFNEKDTLIYFIGLNSYGYDIYRKKPEFNDFIISDYPVSKHPDFQYFQSNKDKISTGGYIDNLKTLFPPKMLRIPVIYATNDSTYAGLYFSGGDVLGHFAPYYGMIIYDFKKNTPQLSFALPINYYAPLYSSINFATFDERFLKFNLEYPIIRKISPGIEDFSIGSSVNLLKDFKRREMEPYFTLNFRLPKTSGGLNIYLPFENRNTGSNISRTGFYPNLWVSQYLSKHKLAFNIKGVYDDDNPETIFKKIRGYKEVLDSKHGEIFSLELSRTILRIRKGIWNPNIFFEDINALIFIDGAVPRERKSQLSSGIELHLETRTMFLLNLDFGIRMSENKENKTSVDIFLKSIL
ncbi:MAG: hypothetical protein HY934_01435 [Candidatus Firestonebacteria bacterium]|nr:hypothetical protein [Candidatus Firestonebacteria bacterium]